MKYDVIIIGSGAGGAAAAYHLTQVGRRVLLLERGLPLPRDGSTLDVARVMRRGEFLADEAWADRRGRVVVPEEHFNLGGKTRWYGAALLRMSPEEFDSDAGHQCYGWPIRYEDIEPFYVEAENLLRVQTFPVEADFARLAAGLRRRDPSWQSHPLQLGLSPDILSVPAEASRFDAFASVQGLKSDAESAFLDRVRCKPNLEIATGKAVKTLIADRDPARIAGVLCEDGSRYEADVVLLAAGALHSPRLLQTYMESAGLAQRLPAFQHVGRNYKSHVLTAMLALSHREVHDVLCKTALLLSERFPHSSVQTLGGSLAEYIIATRFPQWFPESLVRPVGRRVYGLFLQTEDGSHPDNRVVARKGERPLLDYDLARLPTARDEHRALVSTLRGQLLSMGYLGLSQAIPITGTAHACGTLIAGHSPQHSVVGTDGRVHGMDNLYVVDGSVLPRSSRVNPALSIYAWALRVAHSLGASRPAPRNTQMTTA
jgi:choline dehydrogenase-like flavoprotein